MKNRIVELSRLIHEEKLSKISDKHKIQKWQQEMDKLIDDIKQ